MNEFKPPKSNYDKYPFITINVHSNQFYKGWPAILDQIDLHITRNGERCVVVIECYPGVFVEELKSKFRAINFSKVYQASDSLKDERDIDELIYPDVTDDEIFGYITRLNIEDFFDEKKLKSYRKEIEYQNGIILIIGTGACLLAKADMLIYADMPHGEAQLRFRENKAANFGTNNYSLKPSLNTSAHILLIGGYATGSKKKYLICAITF